MALCIIYVINIDYVSVLCGTGLKTLFLYMYPFMCIYVQRGEGQDSIILNYPLRGKINLCFI